MRARIRKRKRRWMTLEVLRHAEDLSWIVVMGSYGPMKLRTLETETAHGPLYKQCGGTGGRYFVQFERSEP